MSIAVALSRGYAIAIDDGRAIKIAGREAELTSVRLNSAADPGHYGWSHPGVGTDYHEADQIKADWEKNHRFRLKERTFRDLL